VRRSTSALTACLSVALAGCVEADYLLHAIEGQLDLACRARSIESAAADDDLDPRTRALLADVPRMKDFAVESGLEPTSSYETFVGLDRPNVVYVVSAAPPLSLEPKRWWFPVAGNVPYLGWFDKNLALQQARWLEADGWDVDVRGASAYSTLGWFDDPVLSSMIEDADDALAELANVILHESVHATVYIPGQSSFNEGLATYIGDELTVRYLDARFGPGSDELTSWLEGETRGREIRERFHRGYDALSALYASDLPDTEKLAKKKTLLAEIQADVRFRRPITNATLAGYSTYHSSRDEFARLWEACSQEPRLMIEVTKTLRAEDFPEANAEDLAKTVDGLVAKCRVLPRPAGATARRAT
jgi:predicted aminopeptidase